ncbi:MAG TPA: hypothetical protein VFG30_42615 [Polyangiales bacterium]|nr:hypothetical protein [Polyangiales bacterium]
MTRLGLLGLVLTLAAPSCTMLASKGDYADYREIRLAKGTDSRLYALQQYAERHPNGLWAKDVEIERSTRETETFENGKSTREGLERYLRAYPDGTFAAQARSRLAAVALIERRRQAEQAEAQQRFEARKQREQELTRTWVTRFAGYWSTTLARLNGWGQPIPDVARQNQQFSRAFGALPRPRCTETECIKYYTSPYGIPVPGGTRVERVLSLVLRLRMTEGKLDRAELLMPAQGFSRWYELEQRKLIASGDGEGRNVAVNWALERLQETLKPAIGDLTALASYTLGPIPAPTIASSGEITDTTAEDPSEPAKQLTAEPGVPPASQPDVATLVKPKEQAGPADMVFSPLGVTKEGRTFQTPTAPGAPPPPTAASGEVMVMDPLAVPRDASGNPLAAPAAPGAPAPAVAPAEVPTPPVVKALQGHGLRVVFFAAAGGATGTDAYDGLIIERVAAATAPAAAGKPAKPKAAVAPAPTPKPPVARPATPPAPAPAAPVAPAAPAPAAPAPH